MLPIVPFGVVGTDALQFGSSFGALSTEAWGPSNAPPTAMRGDADLFRGNSGRSGCEACDRRYAAAVLNGGTASPRTMSSPGDFRDVVHAGDTSDSARARGSSSKTSPSSRGPSRIPRWSPRPEGSASPAKRTPRSRARPGEARRATPPASPGAGRRGPQGGGRRRCCGAAEDLIACRQRCSELEARNAELEEELSNCRREHSELEEKYTEREAEATFLLNEQMAEKEATAEALREKVQALDRAQRRLVAVEAAVEELHLTNGGNAVELERAMKEVSARAQDAASKLKAERARVSDLQARLTRERALRDRLKQDVSALTREMTAEHAKRVAAEEAGKKAGLRKAGLRKSKDAALTTALRERDEALRQLAEVQRDAKALQLEGDVGNNGNHAPGSPSSSKRSRASGERPDWDSDIHCRAVFEGPDSSLLRYKEPPYSPRAYQGSPPPSPSP